MFMPGGSHGNRLATITSGHEEMGDHHSRDDGSQFSLTGGILPPLGGKVSRKVKLQRLVISPFDYRYRSPPFLLVISKCYFIVPAIHSNIPISHLC